MDAACSPVPKSLAGWGKPGLDLTCRYHLGRALLSGGQSLCIQSKDSAHWTDIHEGVSFSFYLSQGHGMYFIL